MRLVALALVLGLVAVGCASDPADASHDSADVTANPVGALVKDIEDLTGGGMDIDATHLTGSTHLELLKSFIVGENPQDNRLVSGYAFGDGATDFNNDVQEAKLFAPSAVESAVTGAFGAFSDRNDNTIDAKREKLKVVLGKLADKGALFGYDGFGQNGCAAPTSLLVIIDPATKTGWAVDLTPCSES